MSEYELQTQTVQQVVLNNKNASSANDSSHTTHQKGEKYIVQ